MTRRSTVRGVRGLIRDLGRVEKKHEKGLERGLKRAGLWLLREAMKLVPVDSSTLKNSGPLVTRAEGSGFNTVMIVGFGTQYAIYVHEDLNARHASGKQAKFLEEPARTGRSTMSQIIKDEMKR